MALTATMHHLQIGLSDVDRGVYEQLDLRLARHPSESLRYLFTRALAYCLAYEEGIAFSKLGLSSNDEPPVSVRDPQGNLVAWIDVGSPTAERLHKATKAAKRVALFTSTDLGLLQKEMASRSVHKLDEIELWLLTGHFLDALGARLDRTMKFDLTRTDGSLYVTLGKVTLEGTVTRASLNGVSIS